VQTLDRSGERWRALLTHHGLKNADRALITSFVSKVNGASGRVSLANHSHINGGGISVSELVPDPLLADVAGGWTQGAGTVLTSVTDGMRCRQEGSVVGEVRPTASLAATPGLSYALAVDFLNAYFAGGTGTYRIRGGTSGGNQDNIIVLNGVTDEKHERLVAGITAPSATLVVSLFRFVNAYDQSWDVSRVSCARCVLVDNGFNALTKSQELEHGDWTKSNATVSADATAGADGSTTADELIEASDTNQIHEATQTYTRTSVQEYWTGSVFAKPNANQRIKIRLDAGGNNHGEATFDVSTGAITAAAAVNGTAENAYATIHAYPSGWYRCRLSVRLAATTSVQMRAILCDGATNTFQYNGDGSSGLYLWGLQAQRGGQLGRYTPTTTAAITGTDQTGSEIWLKGFDDDAAGQLLAGDFIEVNGQLLQLTADVNSDESGAGLARVMPKVRLAPSDEQGVVLHEPRGTFMLADVQNSWRNTPGRITDTQLELVEDISV
jgi:hypothetical protein